MGRREETRAGDAQNDIYGEEGCHDLGKLWKKIPFASATQEEAHSLPSINFASVTTVKQPHAAGAQASACSSMHVPVVLLAWLSQFFLAKVSRSTNVNSGNRQKADRGCTSRRCDQ